MTFISQANETELVTRAQNGDRNAFSELVRIHAQGVLNVRTGVVARKSQSQANTGTTMSMVIGMDFIWPVCTSVFLRMTSA